jgi:serine/threonine-protein kinase
MGVMAYEVLCGRPPFVGATIDVIRGHMLETPPSMCSLRADIPESVDVVVARMLAKAPADRWPTMQPILEAFASLEREPPRAITVDAAARVPTTAPSGASSSRWAIAAAAVVVAGALGLWATRRTAMPSDAVRVPANDPSVVTTVPAETPPSTKPSTPSAPTVRGDTAMRATVAAARSAPSDTRVAPRFDSAASAAPAPVVAALATPVASPLATPPATPTASPAPSPSTNAPLASLNDARALGRQLVTLLNQRRTRELTALSTMGGEANARAELLRLADRADDFAVGFDRLPSAPTPSSSGFESDCYLDVEWRGGHKIFHLTFSATRADNGWHLVGFGVDVPSL